MFVQKLPAFNVDEIDSRESRYQYISWALISARTGPLYQYKEVAQALFSVKCTDNKVCTYKFCTGSESDKVRLVIGTIPIMRP
jgi:hypothetical protein